MSNNLNKSIVASTTGCKGHYALSRRPGHNRIEDSLPHACQTVKDDVQNIMKMMTNKGIDFTK